MVSASSMESKLLLLVVASVSCQTLPQPTEVINATTWTFHLGDSSYTLDWMDAYDYYDVHGNPYNRSDVTIASLCPEPCSETHYPVRLFQSNNPPLTCDLLPWHVRGFSPGAKLWSLQLKHCNSLRLNCLLTSFNISSVQEVTINADVVPTDDMLTGLEQKQIQSLTFRGKDKTLKKPVPVSSLSTLPDLTTLVISGGIISLPNPFSTLLSLESLELSDGGITYLPPAAFRGLNRLKYLDLSNNKFWNLTEDVFEGLSSLDCLRLSWGELRELPTLARMTPLLASLDAGRNFLQAVPVLSDLLHLEAISLEDNQISTVAPGAFANLPNLKRVEMEGNRITSLPPTVFHNSSSIRVILLHSNMISELPEDVFKGLSKLYILTLSLNRLSSLPPGVFRDLSSLEILHLEKNRLTELTPELMMPLRSLKYLYLDGNRLEVLSDYLLHPQAQLEELYVSNNHLRLVQRQALAGLGSLRVLDLSWNHLTTIYNENSENNANRSTPYDALHLNKLILLRNSIRDSSSRVSGLASVVVI